MKLLLVEDSPDHRRVIANLLTKALGATVLYAMTGEEALTILDDPTFDCILLDNSLPSMSGMEVLYEIGKKRIQTPVIMVTSYGTEEVAVEAMKKGAFYYINKISFNDNKEEVLEVVKKAVEHKRTIVQLRSLENQLQTFLDLSPQVFFQLDDKNQIAFINTRCFNLLGYTQDELTGKKFQKFVLPLDNRTLTRRLNDQRNSPEQFQSFECCAKTKDGSQLELRWIIRSAQDAETATWKIVGAIEDLTKIKATEKKLAADEREANTRVRFLESLLVEASLAIERRFNEVGNLVPKNPNNINTLSLEDLRRIWDCFMQSIGVLNEQGELLRYFIKAGYNSTQWENINLKEAVVRVVKTLKSSVKIVSADNLILTHVSGAGIEMLLRCLLTGIEKRAEEMRSNSVVVESIPGPARSEHTCYTLLNPALHLTPDQIRTAFEPYSNSEVGIKFALAHKIVEHHRGMIWIKQSTQEGTTFCITFPKSD